MHTHVQYTYVLLMSLCSFCNILNFTIFYIKQYSQTSWCLMGNSQYCYRLANMASYYILQPDLVVLDGQQSILL